MEAKTSVDMPTATVSSEKNDEGFIVPSARAVESASKIEVSQCQIWNANVLIKNYVTCFVTRTYNSQCLFYLIR